MTIESARIVLGEQAVGVSDMDILRDIEVSSFLKDLFINYVHRIPRPLPFSKIEGS